MACVGFYSFIYLTISVYPPERFPRLSLIVHSAAVSVHGVDVNRSLYSHDGIV
jgi:hypothetical protein